MMAEITAEVVAEAWKLRKLSAYTMREIAERLDVNREALIQAMATETVTVKAEG